MLAFKIDWESHNDDLPVKYSVLRWTFIPLSISDVRLQSDWQSGITLNACVREIRV